MPLPDILSDEEKLKMYDFTKATRAARNRLPLAKSIKDEKLRQQATQSIEEEIAEIAKERAVLREYIKSQQSIRRSQS